MKKNVIVWFRRDLRVADNEALSEACKIADAVFPIFIWSPNEEAPWQPGAATRWWLHHSLLHLAASLRKLGSALILRQGASSTEITRLIEETDATAVFWNRQYEKSLCNRDAAIKQQLIAGGIDVRSFCSQLLIEPWNLSNGAKKPYLVYTPFLKRLRESYLHQAPIPAPKTIPAPKDFPESLELAALSLLPKLPWADGFATTWNPGETGAHARLIQLLKSVIDGYEGSRNIPSAEGTSKLSPHLHFGEIGPRQIWEAVETAATHKGLTIGADTYLKEIVWREFAYHLLFHYPQLPLEPLRKEFSLFPWKKKNRALRAWQTGHTGYPIVDAGMRELWHTGWMHNRVRMIVASFLVKHLLIPWQDGAKWFWDTLVDADLASNTLGWQWTAGCGPDAAPYFRIFNPITQGEKFDSEGIYIKKWVPELAGLPPKWIHRPWEAPPHVLSQAGISLNKSYPTPIVDHQEARDLALEAYEQVKEQKRMNS